MNNILNTPLDFKFLHELPYHGNERVNLGITEDNVAAFCILCDTAPDGEIIFAYVIIRHEDFIPFTDGEMSYYEVLKNSESIMTFKDNGEMHDSTIIKNKKFIKLYGPTKDYDFGEDLYGFNEALDEFFQLKEIENTPPKVKFEYDLAYRNGQARYIALMGNNIAMVELFHNYNDDTGEYSTAYAIICAEGLLSFINGVSSYNEMVLHSHTISGSRYSTKDDEVGLFEMTGVEVIEHDWQGQEITMTPKQLAGIKEELAKHGFK